MLAGRSTSVHGATRCEKTLVLAAGLLIVQTALIALTFLQEDTWGGAGRDGADDVAFASDGSVYVAGTTVSADGDFDAFLLKYSPARTLLWERTYGTPLNQQTGLDDEFVAGIAVAADDSVYITGQLGTGVLFLAKFDAAGQLVWDSTYGENGTISTGAAIDAAGNIYVSGLSFVIDGGANDTEALILKFTPDGQVVWGRAWGGAGFDAARAVAVGSAGPGPYDFGRASNSAKRPEAHLVVPSTSHVSILPTALGADSGQQLVPDAAVGGAEDAFTLWVRR